MSSLPVVRVALPTPLRRLFDYRAGPAGHCAIVAGTRVRVPFGQRRLIGVAMETAASSELPDERLKPVLERLDPQPIFDPATLALLVWAADYYHHPVGEVLAAALPKALRLGAAMDSAEERWTFTPAGLEAYTRGEPRRAPRQRQLLAALAEKDGAAPRAGQMPRALRGRASRPLSSTRSWERGARRRARSLRAGGWASWRRLRPRLPRQPRRRLQWLRGRSPTRSSVSPSRESASRWAGSPATCCTASRAAARPRSICGWSSARWGLGGAPWCWCRRSG